MEEQVEEMTFPVSEKHLHREPFMVQAAAATAALEAAGKPEHNPVG